MPSTFRKILAYTKRQILWQVQFLHTSGMEMLDSNMDVLFKWHMDMLESCS